MDNLGEERFFVRNYRTVRVGFLDRSWGGRCTFVTVQEIATLLVKDKLASLRYSDEIKGGKLPPAGFQLLRPVMGSRARGICK